MARPKVTQHVAITLTTIAGFGETGTTAPLAELNDFVEKGYVELNPNGADEAGVIGVRITAAGQAALTETAPAVETETAVVAKPTFQIDSAIPVPTGSARGRKAGIYPFEQLEIGQSFFVANPEDTTKSDAFKQLSSTAASATRRHTEGEIVHKRFIVRRVTENAVEGARCWRVAVEV